MTEFSFGEQSSSCHPLPNRERLWQSHPLLRYDMSQPKCQDKTRLPSCAPFLQPTRQVAPVCHFLLDKDLQIFKLLI